MLSTVYVNNWTQRLMNDLCLLFMIVTVNENTIDKTAENAQPRENNDETPVNAPPRLPPKTPFHQVVLTPFNPSNLSNNIDSFNY